MVIDYDKQEPSVRDVLRSCSSQNRKTARMWLYYTLFYWMFPTIAVILGLLLARKPIQWTDLVIHGEFLIYAITMVAGSIRLIAKDVPNKAPFVARQGFNLVSQIMVFPAMVAYGLLHYISSASNSGNLSVPITVGYSITLLAAAFVLSYIVFLIDAERSTPDDLSDRIADAIASTPQLITAEFRELLKEQPTPPIPLAYPEPESDEIEEVLRRITVQLKEPRPDGQDENESPFG